MDDSLVALARDQHDHLQQVAGGVRPDDQPPIGILTGVLDGEGVLDGVEHVGITDAVPAGRRVDVHTCLLYYESPSAGSGAAFASYRASRRNMSARSDKEIRSAVRRRRSAPRRDYRRRGAGPASPREAPATKVATM